MIHLLHADIITYKINDSQDMIISNIQVVNSDTQFVYFKNKQSLNTNQILCSQITQITNDFGDEIKTSCQDGTNNMKNEKNIQLKQKKKLLKKDINKEKVKKKLKEKNDLKVANIEKNIPTPNKNKQNHFNNLLLITLIIILIIINIKKKS